MSQIWGTYWCRRAIPTSTTPTWANYTPCRAARNPRKATSATTAASVPTSRRWGSTVWWTGHICQIAAKRLMPSRLVAAPNDRGRPLPRLSRPRGQTRDCWSLSQSTTFRRRSPASGPGHFLADSSALCLVSLAAFFLAGLAAGDSKYKWTVDATEISGDMGSSRGWTSPSPTRPR
jgi:hypothetical protein